MNIIKLKTISRIVSISIIIVALGSLYMIKNYNNNLNFRIVKKEKLIDEEDLKVNSYTVLIDRLKTDEEILYIGEDIYYKLIGKYPNLRAFELKFVDSYSNVDKPYLKLVYAPGGDINNCYGLVERESIFKLVRTDGY